MPVSQTYIALISTKSNMKNRDLHGIMTETDEPLTFDQIIDLRNRRWKSQTSSQGELLKFKDRYVPMPKIEEMSVYRGQYKDYGFLRSGIYRDENPYRQAVSRAKLKEFEAYLQEVPGFSKISPYRIPIGAIAQHYGLVTDFLDVSSSFAVALFFATCRYDTNSHKYRPLNHKEIKENPYGVIYETIYLTISPDELKIIGFSPLNRPSYQQSIMVRDSNNGNLDRIFFKRRFEHSKRLSNEMFRFFDNGNSLFPPSDSHSLESLASEMKNSMIVNKRFYLEACHEMGLIGTDAEIMSCSRDYTFTDTVPKPSPQEIINISEDLERADFVRNSGIRFTARLSYVGD